MNEESPVELLNSAAFLYLRAIGEPEENALRIVVEEANASPVVEPNLNEGEPESVRSMLSETRPIISDSASFSYELTWRSYISYAVRNESFVSQDKAEVYEGRFLRRYTASKFLDFIARGTFADAIFPGPFAHWGVVTLNHVIDVASLEAPRVRRFRKNQLG